MPASKAPKGKSEPDVTGGDLTPPEATPTSEGTLPTSEGGPEDVLKRPSEDAPERPSEDAPERPEPATRQPDRLDPTDAQLTGGRGDDLADTVQSERTGTNANVRNRMEAENVVDLDAASSSGPRASGNKFGTSPVAAANFARELTAEADDLLRRAILKYEEASHWRDVEERTSGSYADEDNPEAERLLDRARELIEREDERRARRMEKLKDRFDGVEAGWRS